MSNEIVILSLLIFFARVADVSLGTLRIIFVSRGYSFLAPIVGFFEVFIWIVAIGQIFENVTSFYYYFAYSLGFATGNYVGILIEKKLAIGLLVLNVILTDRSKMVMKALDDENIGYTFQEASGTYGSVHMLQTVIKRKNLPKLQKLLEENHPNAYISVEEVRSVSKSFFPTTVKSPWIRKIKKRK